MPALPASATSALIDTEVERREIIMARAAGRIFRRRAGTTGLEAANLSPDKRLLLPLSYVRVLKPPAGVEPALRPYKGRVLAVDTTEAWMMETVGVEPTPPRCKRGTLPIELHPQGADGWSRTTTVRDGGVTTR